MSKRITLILLITIVLFSCKKDLNTSPILPTTINESFYKRDSRIINGSIKTNSVDQTVLSNVTLIDTLLKELRIIDSTCGFSNKVILKYGIPYWDISVPLKNENGFTTIVTPIVDTNGLINNLIFSYQESSFKFKFKIVNRHSTQNALPRIGEKTGAMFTKNSLNGLFANFDAIYNNKILLASQSSIKSNSTNSIKSNTIFIDFVCWFNVTIGPNYYETSNTQCSYNISFTTDVFGGLNASYDIPDMGGGASYSENSLPLESEGEGLNDDGDVNDIDIDNPVGTTPRKTLPNKITLANGKEVTILFQKTLDGANSQNQVSEKLINALQKALEEANKNYDISSVTISASTNGVHSANSNHYKSLAIDISRINGLQVSNYVIFDLVNALQIGFETAIGRRENFGPALKLKSGVYNPISNHDGHIHFSVDGN